MSTSAQAAPAAPATKGATGAALRELARVVLPVGGEDDVLALYVEGEVLAGTGLVPATPGIPEAPATSTAAQSMDQVLGRRRYRVPAGTRSSFGTYFNAFPAGYWRRWTTVGEVSLSVTTAGAGTVVVNRSNAKGNVQRVAAEAVEGETTSTFALTLKPFNDGGWYWFDLVAGSGDLVLERAAWSAATDVAPGTVTVSITTFDRPDYCARLLRTLGEAEELVGVLDEVLVVDQGRQLVSEDAGFPAASAALGTRLDVVRQGNLGGSGGFSRGMVETVARGRSTYVQLLDDDVMVEPEGIARAVAFADLARTPTIVGGHMFSLYQRTLLHALGERVQKYRFWWGAVASTREDHDLGSGPLRGTPWLHRRVDVDYNGWWMCLIPTAVVRRIGASLPVFIKWDDAEYGLRAAAADVPTVSLPGAAVWHVPWTDKDDAVDWQAYFHARNRVVAALLHSPYPRGGNVVRESFSIQVKHLLSMQYSTAELRLLALEDAMAGWEQLHEDLPTKLGQVREMRSGEADATVRADAGAYPTTKRRKPPRKGRDLEVPEGRVAVLASALSGIVKQLRPVDELAESHPQAAVAHMDARWWTLSQLDSALVSTADGTGAAWYRRDPRRYADLLRRSVAVHQRLLREWPQLAGSYRAGATELTSVERWRTTLGMDAAAQGGGSSAGAQAPASPR